MAGSLGDDSPGDLTRTAPVSSILEVEIPFCVSNWS